jgi:hypothetical protein
MKHNGMSLSQKLIAGVVVVILAGSGLAALTSYIRSEPSDGPRRVWSEEHQHWHTLP